jgi:hypothetical protein
MTSVSSLRHAGRVLRAAIMLDSYPKTLRYIESRRMRLLAATPRLIGKDLKGRGVLSSVLGVDVPPNWPPDLYDRNAMEYALSQLRDPVQNTWSFWYLVENSSDPGQLLGICGFKGRPDESGSVEIGYSILEQFRNMGYATEAVARLVNWAFSHPNVQEVCAETLPHLRQSIRVLEKNGFSCNPLRHAALKPELTAVGHYHQGCELTVTTAGSVAGRGLHKLDNLSSEVSLS